MIEGSQPAIAIDLILALMVSPRDLAFSSDMISIAAAPSDRADEEPAVTVPEAGSNTGRNCDNPSTVVSGRITSS